MNNNVNNGNLTKNIMEEVDNVNDAINKQASIDNITNINDRNITINNAFEYKYASFSDRFMAGLIDGGLNIILVIALFFIFNIINIILSINGIKVNSTIAVLIIYFESCLVIVGFTGASLLGVFQSIKKHVTTGEKFSKIKFINYNGSDLSNGKVFLKFIVNACCTFIWVIDVIFMNITSKKQRISEMLLKVYCISEK